MSEAVNRWAWAVLVLTVYGASFALPAYLDLAGHEAFVAAARAGFEAWCDDTIGRELLGWLPNPLLWTGLALLCCGRNWGAAVLGLAGLVAGAGAWLTLGDLHVGYYAWLGSMALLMVGAAWFATGTQYDEIV